MAPMTWWFWALVGVACWFAGNLLLLGIFAVLSFVRGEPASGADSVTFG